VIGSLADEHVPGPLIKALTQRGMDIVTVVERGLRSADDAVILSLALQERRLLLTCDTDFLALAAALGRRSEPFAPILFWPQQRRTIRELLARIIPIANEPNYTALCSQVHFL
jgi:hypothetical protein